MPKVKYKINNYCSRCEQLKQVRYDGNQVYVCKGCDKYRNIFNDQEDQQVLKYKKAS